MTETTEYLAVPRNRLYQITVLLFLLGLVIGLIIGNLIWAPEPPEPDGPKPRPGHENVEKS